MNLSASETLLLGHAAFAPGADLLLLGCGTGALATALAAACAPMTLHAFDIDLLTLRQAGEALRAAKASNSAMLESDTPFAALNGRCAGVALLAPPERDLARRWLLAAYVALRPAGRLFLAGAKAEGIESIIADAKALFGNAQLLAYRKGCRVVMAIRGDDGLLPAWANEPGIAADTWQQFAVDLPTGRIELRSLPGVFAYDRLDDGTALLLRQLVVKPGARVLDPGCGCGVLGIAAALAGAAHVDLSDVNLSAVAAARENADRLAPGRCRVYAANELAGARGPYDLVVMNPPFHRGKLVDYAMAHGLIIGARAQLAAGGHLLVVMNRFLAHERLLAEHYADVALLADDGRYRVWMATA